MTTSTNDLAYGLYVGVDIAETIAKVSWLMPGEAPSRAISMEQTPSGVLSTPASASLHGPLCSSISGGRMEATGSYWISLATTLTQCWLCGERDQPGTSPSFCQGLLKRAKTDAIDAQTLAQLAYLLHPTPWTPPPPVYAELQQRLAQRDSLLELRQQVRNQLHALSQMPSIIATVRTRMEQLIETLTQQLVAVDAELEAALECDPSWAASAQRLQTIIGIGPLVAAWLLVTRSTSRSVRALKPSQPMLVWLLIPINQAPVCMDAPASATPATPSAYDLVSGDALGRSTQPCDQSLLRALARRGQTHESRSLRCGTQIVASGLCRGDAQGGFRSSLSDSATATASDNTVTDSTPHRPLQER